MSSFFIRLKQWWDYWRTLLLLLAAMLLFRSAIADWNQVPTPSMLPTILPGDRVVVNKLAYQLRVPFTNVHLMRWKHPKRGEIVTFESPSDGKLLIKRVIGEPGDVVTMRANQLFINDAPAVYSDLSAEVVSQLSDRDQRGYRFFSEQITGFGDESSGPATHAVMLLPSLPNETNSFGPITVPADHYLMLGDNRDNSSDSRRIGFVSRDLISGRAHTVAFSVDYDDYYLPRESRFMLTLD